MLFDVVWLSTLQTYTKYVQTFSTLDIQQLTNQPIKQYTYKQSKRVNHSERYKKSQKKQKNPKSPISQSTDENKTVTVAYQS